MIKERLNKYFKIIPWYYGFSGDLLFFIAIDTLFLTIVKGLSASEFSLLTTISVFSAIVFQPISLKIIKKIGNTYSVRLGAFFLFLSAVLITFSESFLGIILGKIIYENSFVYKNMCNVALRKNLKYENHEHDYVKIYSKGNVIFAVVMAIIALVTSNLFNFNHYLPMYFCILITFGCFLVSFLLFDVYEENNGKVLREERKNNKVPWSKILILIMLSFGLALSCIVFGESQGKLFIQNTLMEEFSVESVALLIGLMISVSRIARIISNLAFTRVYDYFKEKTGILLSILLVMSFICFLTGYFLNIPLMFRFVIMGLGYFIILVIRDPLKLYIQDILFNNCPTGFEQDLTANLELARNIGVVFVSAIATLILLYHSIAYVIFMVLIVSIVELCVIWNIYKIIKEH